jgi:tetraacyldisaccharide 4'-kinase
LSALLAPLGFVFGQAAALRFALHSAGWLPSFRPAGPVISVGNLAVGGRSKTPLVAHVASLLRDAGLPVAVLSRGYRGRFAGDMLLVSDGSTVSASWQEAGDEPVLLARELPGVIVAVGRRRDRVAAQVEARFGRRVHVLDDGFQHLRLQRELDLVCLRAADLQDRPLPAGRLREWPAALARADAVLLVEGDAEPGLPTFRVERVGRGFATLEGKAAAAPERPFLLSGIAGPERFEADLRSLAGELAGLAIFPDHHAFTAAELREVQARARAAGAGAVVTTAKDAVRIPGWDGPLPLLVSRIGVRVSPAAAFEAMVLAAGRAAS